MNIKVGTPIAITNFSKMYKFCDSKGRPIIPTSYKSLSKHFDNLIVVEVGEEFIKAKIVANNLYTIKDIEIGDFEIQKSYYVINSITGAVEIVKEAPYMAQLLGLVFESEEEALQFIENKEKENN